MEVEDYLSIILSVIAIASFVIFYQSLSYSNISKSLLALLATILSLIFLKVLNPWIIPKRNSRKFKK